MTPEEILWKAMREEDAPVDLFKMWNDQMCRVGWMVDLRERVWFRMKQAGLSYPAIARMTNKRGHSTIIEAVKRYEAKLEREREELAAC